MTKVIVAGGGVGGLTAAIALRQAGIEVQLYEQADALRPIGSGLHIWTNAVKVLQGLGVGRQAREHSSEMQRAEFRTAGGGLIASWPIVEISRELGAPTLQVSREELSNVLGELRRTTAPSISAARSPASRSPPTGVEVRFEDGTTEQADVLVGADGLRSAVRAQILGDEPPREAGYTVWRGVVHRGEPHGQAGHVQLAVRAAASGSCSTTSASTSCTG